jgi:hypothetical protein
MPCYNSDQCIHRRPGMTCILDSCAKVPSRQCHSGSASSWWKRRAYRPLLETANAARPWRTTSSEERKFLPELRRMLNRHQEARASCGETRLCSLRLLERVMPWEPPLTSASCAPRSVSQGTKSSCVDHLPLNSFRLQRPRACVRNSEVLSNIEVKELNALNAP